MKNEQRGGGERRENEEKKKRGKNVGSCQSEHDIKSLTSGFSSSPR